MALRVHVQLSTTMQHGKQNILFETNGSVLIYNVLMSRDVVDSLNADYAQYYKHAIETDYAGDDSKWEIIRALIAFR